MHSTEALPLTARPNVEQYKKLAKELLAAVKSGDAGAVLAFARDWFRRLYELSGARADDQRRGEGIENEARRFAGYWSGERKVRDIPPPQATLAHAQFIIARAQGFATWKALLDHIETIRRS